MVAILVGTFPTWKFTFYPAQTVANYWRTVKPLTLDEARDKAAMSAFKLGRPHQYSFAGGWDAALAHLRETEYVFDEKCAKNKSYDHTDLLEKHATGEQEANGWYPDYKVENAFVEGARHQFDRDRERIALAEARANIANSQADLLVKRVKELEAERKNMLSKIGNVAEAIASRGKR